MHRWVCQTLMNMNITELHCIEPQQTNPLCSWQGMFLAACEIMAECEDNLSVCVRAVSSCYEVDPI